MHPELPSTCLQRDERRVGQHVLGDNLVEVRRHDNGRAVGLALDKALDHRHKQSRAVDGRCTLWSNQTTGEIGCLDESKLKGRVHRTQQTFPNSSTRTRLFLVLLTRARVIWLRSMPNADELTDICGSGEGENLQSVALSSLPTPHPTHRLACVDTAENAVHERYVGPAGRHKALEKV